MIETIYVLIGFVVFTNLFWVSVCFRLVNRLMSKNYGEYIQSKKYYKQKPGREEVTPDEDVIGFDDYAAKQAETLNKAFNL